MFRTVIDIVLAALISVALTLAVVTWSKTSTLERQIAEVQRGVKENSKKIEEAAKETKVSGEHGAPHGGGGGDAHAAQAAPHWGYEGAMNPAKWGDAFPVCGTGHSQSPVDIKGPFDKATQPIKLEYKSGPLKILNNGHTIQVMATPGSKMKVGADEYELLQFHFHRPSEELIEGKPSAMVAHFVHKSAGGKLAVIGVLMNEGKENATLRLVFSNAPKQEGPEALVPAVEFNPGDLFPAKLNYYSYEGSLTTPPCTEGVTFFILKTAGSVSREQVDSFPFKLNARPIQPLNGRKILSN